MLHRVRRSALWGGSALLAAALTLMAGPLDAQTGTGRIRGKVTNAANGQPIPGQIGIVGQGLGATTGADGSYLISGVPAGTFTLRARALGYTQIDRQVTMTAGGTVTIDFALNVAPASLNEVVVTGTAGSARKREVGNSIGSVKASDLPEVPTNVSNLLAGRVAGVQISGGLGNAGSGSAIRLRGATSLALSNQPLIYVDGVRTRSDEYPRNGIFQGATQRGANAYGSPLNDINPDDIDRIEVVKGAAGSTTEFRMVCDLRALNAQTEPMVVETESIQQMCRRLAGDPEVDGAAQLGLQPPAEVRHQRCPAALHGSVHP